MFSSCSSASGVLDSGDLDVDCCVRCECGEVGISFAGLLFTPFAVATALLLVLFSIGAGDVFPLFKECLSLLLWVFIFSN